MAINTQGGLILVEGNSNHDSFYEISLNEEENGAFLVYHPDLNSKNLSPQSDINPQNEMLGMCIPRGELLALGHLLIDMGTRMKPTVMPVDPEEVAYD